MVVQGTLAVKYSMGMLSCGPSSSGGGEGQGPPCCCVTAGRRIVNAWVLELSVSAGLHVDWGYILRHEGAAAIETSFRNIGCRNQCGSLPGQAVTRTFTGFRHITPAHCQYSAAAHPASPRAAITKSDQEAPTFD
jgi:hypothetical protein